MAVKRLCPTICTFNHGRAVRETLRTASIWGQGVGFHAFSTRVQALPERKPLVLRGSEFQHLCREGPTEAIYRETLFQALSPSKQGSCAETGPSKLCRK